MEVEVVEVVVVEVVVVVVVVVMAAAVCRRLVTLRRWFVLWGWGVPTAASLLCAAPSAPVVLLR